MLKKLLSGIIPPTKKKEEMPDNQLSTSGAVETPATTQRLDSLMNIDTAFQKTRLIAILSLVMSFLLCITVMIVAMTMVTKGKGKIYVTNGFGDTTTARQIAANENRQAEAKAQVRKFHALLYDITPDPSEIEMNLNEILLIGDGSVKAFLDKRGDGYYKKLISNDVEIKYSMDSIKVNTQVYPFKAVQYGKEVVETSVGFLVKNLITRLELREVARTDANPHGLLVGNYEVLKNNRIQFVENDK